MQNDVTRKEYITSVKRNPKVKLMNILGELVEPNENQEFGPGLPAGKYFKVGEAMDNISQF